MAASYDSNLNIYVVDELLTDPFPVPSHNRGPASTKASYDIDIELYMGNDETYYYGTEDRKDSDPDQAFPKIYSDKFELPGMIENLIAKKVLELHISFHLKEQGTIDVTIIPVPIYEGEVRTTITLDILRRYLLAILRTSEDLLRENVLNVLDQYLKYDDPFQVFIRYLNEFFRVHYQFISNIIIMVEPGEFFIKFLAERYPDALQNYFEFTPGIFGDPNISDEDDGDDPRIETEDLMNEGYGLSYNPDPKTYSVEEEVEIIREFLYENVVSPVDVKPVRRR